MKGDEHGWSLYDYTKALAIAEGFDKIAKREYWCAVNAVEVAEPAATTPMVDLSGLCHRDATMEYLAILGEQVKIVGYDDGRDLHCKLQKRGDEPLGRVLAPRNRGSVTNSPDGKRLP